MAISSNHQEKGSRRWRYVLLAALALLLAVATLVAVWQVPHLFSQFVEVPAAMALPTAMPSPATPTPGLLQPAFTDLSAQVDDGSGTVAFHMAAQVPADRQVAEAILWYDTEVGHRLQRSNGPFTSRVAIQYNLDTTREALTSTLTSGQLDYWWWVRDTAGDSIRAGGTVTLGSVLQSRVVTATQEPPPIEFTWPVSETDHFRFHYLPGSAAERDLSQLGALAEAALARTMDVVDIRFDGQMNVYLVPRVFWQGGATYQGKVQLISYLDRNYTSVEPWSLFTHEGTHALAQDLLHSPKNGSPDGVLIEGLAVWASGGHYRREPLDARAAITAVSDDYIPLADLRAGPFYDFQHEISYMEAASFVKFLIEQYGLEKLKELYGLASSDAAQDEALVQRLYGQSYAELEAEWLAYLADLSPTPEQARAWQLEVRSFDLMRRYETELDPDARLLPAKPPTEWLSDTLQIFFHRRRDPVNVVLETALIAGQERLHSGDLDGAAALFDDVEAALEAGGELSAPSLEARQAILEVLVAQDRAVLRADADAYQNTLDQTYRNQILAADKLRPPFITYQQEVIRLDITDDGLHARGVVLLHAQTANGRFASDGQLLAMTFSKVAGEWLMSSQSPTEPFLPPPSVLGD